MTDLDMRFIDWFRIMADLKDAGYSISAISSRIHIPEPTLKAYRRSSEPTYSRGQRILEFWSVVTSKRTSEAPIIENVLATCTA